MTLRSVAVVLCAFGAGVLTAPDGHGRVGFRVGLLHGELRGVARRCGEARSWNETHGPEEAARRQLEVLSWDGRDEPV
jgi:hypothetical protein